VHCTDVVDDDPAVAEAAVGAAEERLSVRRPRHGARRVSVVHPVAVVGDGVAEAEEPREARAAGAAVAAPRLCLCLCLCAADEDRAGGDEEEPRRRGENAGSRGRRCHGSITGTSVPEKETPTKEGGWCSWPTIEFLPAPARHISSLLHS